MPIACKYCIAERGLWGSDIGSLPDTEEELIRHIESYYHMPVRRPGETPEGCIQRFVAEHPEAASCPRCREAGAP
jgi:hypothetical protein